MTPQQALDGGRRRNRLSHTKANKLVYLFHNVCIMRKMRAPKYSEPTVAWADEEEGGGQEKSRIPQYTLALFKPSKLLMI